MPIIPIILAFFTTGGAIVPHAAGGVIVSNAVAGYVAGTYLSTATICMILSNLINVSVFASLSVFSLFVAGSSTAIIGGAGFLGTTIGATGLTGMLMSIGVIPSTPIILVVFLGVFLMLLGYFFYEAFKIKKKFNDMLNNKNNANEVIFTNFEAKIIEIIIRMIDKFKKPK
jgi:hypothetical protein